MSCVPLHELLDLSDSGVWGDEDTENGISVLRSTNFNKNGTLDFTKLTFRVIEERKRTAKLLQEGDILLEKSGGGPQQPVGRVCLYRGHALQHSFGNFIARLRPKANILSEFLFYFLWHFHSTGKTSHYQKQTTGIRNLEFKRFLTIEVPVPPIPEQRRIVDILSRAEGIVRLRREAQKKAAELIPGIFLDMFGDPATNPKGWPVVTLGEVVEEFRYGTSQKSGPTGFPVLRIPNVVGDRLEPSVMKFVEVQEAEANRLRLLDGDFLFVRTNGNPDYVGRSAVFESEVMQQAGFNGMNTLYASYLIRARIQRSRLEPYFLQGYLSSTEGRQKLKERCRTSAGQFNINTDGLASIPVPLPPLALQLGFVQHCRDVFGIQSQQDAATEKAEAAFAALLAQVFSPAI